MSVKMQIRRLNKLHSHALDLRDVLDFIDEKVDMLKTKLERFEGSLEIIIEDLERENQC